jgi:hypothetical protein
MQDKSKGNFKKVGVMQHKLDVLDFKEGQNKVWV